MKDEQKQYTLQDVKALAEKLNIWVNPELGVIDLVPQDGQAGNSISLAWNDEGIQEAMRWLHAREDKS